MRTVNELIRELEALHIHQTHLVQAIKEAIENEGRESTKTEEVF
jgi:hypothetical protein